MLRTRIIPALLLHEESLVKTVRFGKFRYIGDPANTVRIFNELEVDELVFLDITATRQRRRPSLRVLADIANECFMPLGYGGGLRTMEDVKAVFDIGFEKVVVNSYAVENPAFVTQLAERYGSQAVIGSIDVKRGRWRGEHVRTHAGRRAWPLDPVEWAQELAARGAGEILLTSIDREGTWSGFDLDILRRVASAVDVPVIAHGGAGSVAHIAQAVSEGSASAVAVGSMVVFQKKDKGVLVNFPVPGEVEAALHAARRAGLPVGA